ncbi:unnamed protein product, partial [marine sediment metagenome]
VIESETHGISTQSRRLQATAMHEKTTKDLSGAPPRKATHKIVPTGMAMTPEKMVPIGLNPPGYKLKMLTTGGGGLGSPVLEGKYTKVMEKREEEALRQKKLRGAVDLNPEADKHMYEQKNQGSA